MLLKIALPLPEALLKELRETTKKRRDNWDCLGRLEEKAAHTTFGEYIQGFKTTHNDPLNPDASEYYRKWIESRVTPEQLLAEKVLRWYATRLGDILDALVVLHTDVYNMGACPLLSFRVSIHKGQESHREILLAKGVEILEVWPAAVTA